MTTTPTATPKDQRDAWLRLVTHLEAQLLSTRENAKTSLRIAVEGITFAPEDPAEWQATVWAAQRLLDAIQGLPVPEVPVDHTEGQASILDVLACTCPNDCDCDGYGPMAQDPPSTSGDEPVEHAPGQEGVPEELGGKDAATGIRTMLAAVEEHRPRRVLDKEGELWEELEDGRWGYCPPGADVINDGPYAEGPGSAPYGPVRTLEELVRLWGPVREPEGDEYDRGARDDE